MHSQPFCTYVCMSTDVLLYFAHKDHIFSIYLSLFFCLIAFASNCLYMQVILPQNSIVSSGKICKKFSVLLRVVPYVHENLP